MSSTRAILCGAGELGEIGEETSSSMTRELTSQIYIENE